MLKAFIKRTAYTLAPALAASLDEELWLKKKIADLLRRTRHCRHAGELLAALEENGGFPCWQRRSEILNLLELVAHMRPRRALEIGSLDGGTLFLLTQVCGPDARVYSIDIKYSPAKRRTFPRFARDQQTLLCIEGDSQARSTRARLEKLLWGEPLDFVFIDGDHRYGGVSADFAAYAPLVRPGGLVALHDIVPDHRQRYGKETCVQSGEVPRFWKELRERFTGCHEFIEDPFQDGCGIGVIPWGGNDGQAGSFQTPDCVFHLGNRDGRV